jgi:hypothetical protein
VKGEHLPVEQDLHLARCAKNRLRDAIKRFDGVPTCSCHHAHILGECRHCHNGGVKKLTLHSIVVLISSESRSVEQQEEQTFSQKVAITLSHTKHRVFNSQCCEPSRGDEKSGYTRARGDLFREKKHGV